VVAAVVVVLDLVLAHLAAVEALPLRVPRVPVALRAVRLLPQQLLDRLYRLYPAVVAQLLPRQQPVPLEVAVPEVAAAVVLVQGLVASEILRRR